MTIGIPGPVVGIVGGVFFVTGLLMGSLATKDRLEMEAVEMEKAHWCIEDHKQVFSWEECE